MRRISDESSLRLMVFPVALGSGLRVFPETSNRTVFEHADTQVFSSGVVAHTSRAS